MIEIINLIDESLVLYFKTQTFTVRSEDIEFQCHGGVGK